MIDLTGSSETSALDPATPLSESDDVELDIRESIEELRARGPSEDSSDEDTTTEEASDSEPLEEEQPEAQLLDGQEQTEEEGGGEPVAPPSGWNAQAKEWFAKQPRAAQQEFARRDAEMMRHFHGINQQWSQVRKEHADIEQALQPYEKVWASQGLTRGQAVQGLVRAQMILDSNLIGGLDQIARSYGYSLQDIFQHLQKNGATPQQISPAQDPHFQQLNHKVQSLEQALSAREQSAVQQQQAAASQEMMAAREEKDEYGRYLRPELHDQQFLNSLAPTYAGLKQAFPAATPRELLLKAYTAHTGKNPQPRTQQIQHSRNAQKASMSVRSGAPRTSPVSEDGKDNESVEETLLRSAKQIGYRL